MKVFASDISNLTDARYFAAWGIDLLIYDVDPLQSDQWKTVKEMIDWVEGPAPAIKIDALALTSDHHDCIAALELRHLLIGSFVDTSPLADDIQYHRITPASDIAHIQEDSIVIIDKPVSDLGPALWQQLNEIAKKYEIIIDGPISVEDIDLIENSRLTGLLLRGGEEEKVGFKSYDELDAILEKIYDAE